MTSSSSLSLKSWMTTLPCQRPAKTSCPNVPPSTIFFPNSNSSWRTDHSPNVASMSQTISDRRRSAWINSEKKFFLAYDGWCTSNSEKVKFKRTINCIFVIGCGSVVSALNVMLYSVSTLICKIELHLVITVLRKIGKVRWVELWGTDSLFTIIRLATWLNKDPNTPLLSDFIVKRVSRPFGSHRPPLQTMPVEYFSQHLAAATGCALQALVKNCFFHIFVAKKLKQEEKAGNLMQNLAKTCF